jgi:hypothetical protein
MRFTCVSGGNESNPRRRPTIMAEIFLLMLSFLQDNDGTEPNDHLFTHHTKYAIYDLRFMIYTTLHNFVLNFGFLKKQIIFYPSELFPSQGLCSMESVT